MSGIASVFTRKAFRIATMAGAILALGAVLTVLTRPGETRSAIAPHMMIDGKLAATIDIPAHAGLRPAVLMLHGFGGNRHESGDLFDRIAGDLHRRGIATLRIDFPAFGESPGRTEDVTVEQELAAAKLALTRLRAMPGIDPDRIGVLGFSMGGGIAILLAGEEKAGIKTMVTLSAVGNFHADFLSEMGQKTFDKALAEGVVRLKPKSGGFALSRAFFESLDRFDLKAAAARYPNPYFAIAGADDWYARYPDDFALAAGYFPREVRIIPGARHDYGASGDNQDLAEEVIALSTQWLADKL